MAIVSILLCAACGSSGAAEPPLKIAEGAYPDLCLDAQGGVHLAYAREGALYYRFRDPASGAWSEEMATGLEAGMAERSDPEIAIDSQGRPHIFGGSSYACLRDGAWAAVKPNVVRDTAMALDSKDRVYLTRRGGFGDGFIGLLVLEPGAEAFAPLPDPDTANGLPVGRNNHVYSHIFVNPADDSLHIVFRHGMPKPFAYRVSRDGGNTWQGASIGNDDAEAPSGAAGPDGAIYAVGGNGTVWRRGAEADDWTSLGRALSAGSRDLPVLAAAAGETLAVACFGGKLNTRLGGQWTGEQRLPSLEGKPLGFVDLAIGADNLVYAVWEEGDALDKEEKNGESSILFARMNLQPEEEAATAPPVGLWDRFEAQIGNSKPYRDPFRDVSLDVSYIRPDGTAVGFWGFHDGGTVWKIRFMPDQLGLWKYEARFSDGTPGGRGAFECVESDIPGMFSIYPENPIWYAYKGGQPVWVRSLHIGDRFFAANWSPEERALFLDWVGEQGYNMLSVASHYLNRQEADRGLSWKTPALWPPNPEEYRLLEEMMDDLARRKIIVYPFAGFFGKRSNYPREQADQQLHIRYALARLGPYWNTMPNVAGPEPNVGNIWMQSSEVEYLARQIKKFDVFDHPLSVHNKTGDNPYLDAAWNEYVTLQGPKTLDRAKLSEGLLRNLNPAKPLFAQETLWSDNENHPAYTDEDIRKNAFVIGVSGATFCFGDMKGNSSTGFSGTLAMDERNQARHDIVKAVWDFFETIPWWRMNPRQDLVDAGYCLAKPGERYLVYLDEPGTVNVKLEGGPYKVEWIDARDTAKRQPAPSTRDGQGLKSPAEGDWLLYLTPAAETKLRAAADADR